jgi:hypothetical protein
LCLLALLTVKFSISNYTYRISSKPNPILLSQANEAAIKIKFGSVTKYSRYIAHSMHVHIHICVFINLYHRSTAF